jgi:hypothetical protein
VTREQPSPAQVADAQRRYQIMRDRLQAIMAEVEELLAAGYNVTAAMGRVFTRLCTHHPGDAALLALLGAIAVMRLVAARSGAQNDSHDTPPHHDVPR